MLFISPYKTGGEGGLKNFLCGLCIFLVVSVVDLALLFTSLPFWSIQQTPPFFFFFLFLFFFFVL